MKGCCIHGLVIGHVCTECPTGTADVWEEIIMECTGNAMEKSDCVLHDDCRCKHNEHPGFCLDCANPNPDRHLEAENDRLRVELSRCKSAFESISSIARSLLDDERRAGPGMSNLQQAEASGRCVSDAAEGLEKESKQ